MQDYRTLRAECYLPISETAHARAGLRLFSRDFAGLGTGSNVGVSAKSGSRVVRGNV